MLVDAHTHLLPDRLAAAIRRFFADAGAPPMAYPTEPRAVLDRHAADGVDAVWTLPYAHRPGMAADLNASMAALVGGLADHPVEVVLGCTAHPGDPDPAGDVRRAVTDLGARVLKLHCSVGGYAPDDPGLAPVLDVAGELGVPVVLHAGVDPSGRTAAPDLSTMPAVLRRHPQTTVILAHLGHPATAAALALMADHPSAWADLTPVVVEAPAVDAAALAPVADRILLGSDAPNTTLPLADLLGWLDCLGLADDARAGIVGGNAARLVPGPRPLR